jgi:hypothetical protein
MAGRGPLFETYDSKGFRNIIRLMVYCMTTSSVMLQAPAAKNEPTRHTNPALPQYIAGSYPLTLTRNLVIFFNKSLSEASQARRIVTIRQHKITAEKPWIKMNG